MQKTKRLNVRVLATIGVLSALVFVLSSISIPLSDLNRIHFGNIMCLLSGLLFGPFVGGISAGLGSMLYDFTNPLFMPEFWITFINKFLMAFVAGLLARKLEGRVPTPVRFGVSALAGSVTYSVLYLFKMAMMQHFITGNPWSVVWPLVGTNAIISLVNGLLSVVACVLLAPILRTALDSAGMFRPKHNHS